MNTTWLIDKSAVARIAHSADAEEWTVRIQRGLVRVSTVTRLELGFSARTGADHAQIFGTPPVSVMPVEYVTPAIEDRAVDVQRFLAERGVHRAPSIPDLLIAATAELSGCVVLHMDKDFELIAEVTGQPVVRLRMLD